MYDIAMVELDNVDESLVFGDCPPSPEDKLISFPLFGSFICGTAISYMGYLPLSWLNTSSITWSRTWEFCWACRLQSMSWSWAHVALTYCLHSITWSWVHWALCRGSGVWYLLPKLCWCWFSRLTLRLFVSWSTPGSILDGAFENVSWLAANCQCVLHAWLQCASPTALRSLSFTASSNVSNLEPLVLCFCSQSFRILIHQPSIYHRHNDDRGMNK